MTRARLLSLPAGLAATTLLLRAALVPAGPAAAHEEVPGIRNVLDAVEPALPAGVTVQVQVSAADQLVVENRTPTDLVVLGEQLEPFLRIGPAGVLANLQSPAWYLSNAPEGAQVPAGTDPTAAPRWAKVSDDPTWGWFDHRLHRSVLTTPPEAAPGETVRIEDWQVGARYGDQELVLRGHREYRRPGGAFVARVVSTPDGLTAQVLPGTVPALVGQTDAPQEPFVLRGAEGEPFVRFTSRGVEVNEASPTWALTVRAKTGNAPNGVVGASLTPRWAVQGEQPTLLWLEPRAQYPQELPPDAALRAEQPTTVLRWEVPVEVGGRTQAIRGETQWVPESARSAALRSEEAAGLPLWPFGAGAAALVGVALLLRRRA